MKLGIIGYGKMGKAVEVQALQRGHEVYLLTLPHPAGSEKFEERLDDGKIHVAFPKSWENADDRYDAREIIDENLERLAWKKTQRRKLMEHASRVDGPLFTTKRHVGRNLNFHYVVTNLNSGHNLPSGSLGAQPQLWLNVVLTDLCSQTNLF